VNLAVNARDAMPEGGTLTLRTGHMTLYRPLVSGAETIPPGRYVMIEVSDTGVGIPEDLLSRIFDPFFTTKRERGGHGLGLSTVHGIVRQSGGFLAVESEVGQGTRFRIYLPRWDEQDAVDIPTVPVAAPPPEARTPEAARQTILLVEDEEPVRRLAERSFRRRGWEVLAADSGEAALALLDATNTPISAIVTDMVMPGMDGAALLRAVRARPGMERVPAVLVSGYADEGLRKELESSRTSFLPKPYMPQELVARVAQVLAAAETRAKV
jgi:two-component system cell cycle sensor histidine kinase/response regulator CckA